TDDIRRLVHGLRPPVLDDLGLVEAIRRLITQVARSGLDVTASLPDTLAPLPAAVETACYFICQESLNNVLRHAQASYCHLEMRISDALCLSIEDDGVGIPAKHHTGIGLLSMRRRAIEIGGTFAVTIRPEGGTRVDVCLPIEGD
ncbi:MAG: sensor histidine kinase, partial [Ardenticatenia bacterium]